ncbi:MAG TPA: MFS transporter, partial [Trichococcus sp.]|nr:MFS transporter [Trichococcus sp.]
ISFSVMSVGMFLIASSNSVLQTSIAAVICGFSFRTFLPYLFNKVSTSSAGNAAYRTSLILVGFNVGAAFSPYGIVVLERLFRLTSVRGIFYIEAAILLGLAVFLLVMTLKKPWRSAQVAAAE